MAPIVGAFMFIRPCLHNQVRNTPVLATTSRKKLRKPDKMLILSVKEHNNVSSNSEKRKSYDSLAKECFVTRFCYFSTADKFMK